MEGVHRNWMKDNRLGLWLLTALVTGNMVGSGIFMLPRSLAEQASPLGVLLAWVLTGGGVLMLALVFGNLALRKPDITGGPQLYAKSLFKEGSRASSLIGYLVSWGYWVANWAGNVAVITTFASYLSIFFPVMTSEAVWLRLGGMIVKEGNLITLLVCSILLWAMHFLILHGIEGAGKLNFWATAAKVAGFVILIIAGLAAFQAANMLPLEAPRLNEAGREVGLFGQINHAAVSTLWAFIGVESAVVFSSRARKKSDVKKATILGLMVALVIYIGITVLVMGNLTQNQLIASVNPLVDVLGSMAGSSGQYLMGGLGLIALTGSMLGWVLLSAEVPYQAAKQGLFPEIFKKANAGGAPTVSLTCTNIMMQVLLFSLISKSIAKYFDFVTLIATLSYLIPYLFASVYQLKLTVTGETYTRRRSRWVDGGIAAIAAAYSLWVIQAGTADWRTFLLGMAMIAAGIIFYPFVPKPATTK